MASKSLLQDVDHDISNQKFNANDDPLLKQLPKELHEFVIRPQDHQDKVEYVQRAGTYALIHKAISALCCCYSICRMHLIEQGQMGLTQNADKPEILGPGRHTLLSPFNEWIGVRNVTDPVIRHGPLHIIRIEMGQLGYAVDMKSGRPILLARGKHVINSNSFLWKNTVSFQSKVTKLDNLKVIRIETGYVGYAYRRGNLSILQPGLHLIEPPDRFGNILSTQIQIIELPHAVHETSDYVELAIKSAIFFRIVKPERALRRISNIKQQITETAIATIAGIIRSSSLSDIASRSQPFYHKKQQDEKNKNKNQNQNNNNNPILATSPTDQPSAPPFFQHVHDEFIQQLHDHVLDEWGIEIQNIRIESLKINDPVLQKSISNQAIDVSKQHNKYIMLQKKSEIIMVETNAKSQKKKIDTDAASRAIRARAQAAADAIIIQAKADKQAIELKGQGEAEYARLLENTKLGADMSVMQIQSDALKNLDAVAYIPHLPDILTKNGLFAQSNDNKKK